MMSIEFPEEEMQFFISKKKFLTSRLLLSYFSMIFPSPTSIFLNSDYYLLLSQMICQLRCLGFVCGLLLYLDDIA